MSQWYDNDTFYFPPDIFADILLTYTLAFYIWHFISHTFGQFNYHMFSDIFLSFDVAFFLALYLAGRLQALGKAQRACEHGEENEEEEEAEAEQLNIKSRGPHLARRKNLRRSSDRESCHVRLVFGL